MEPYEKIYVEPYEKIYIEGPDAEKAAEGLALLIEREFGQKPVRLCRERQHQDEHHPEDHARKDAATVAAIASVILAVPAAVLAAIDLVQRIRNKPKIDQLIEWAKQQREKDPHLTININTYNGQVIHLHTATSAELLDAFSILPDKSQLPDKSRLPDKRQTPDKRHHPGMSQPSDKSQP